MNIDTIEASDFSLVDGGLLFQIWRYVHLAGHLLRFICGRIVVLLLIVWSPWMLLSMVGDPSAIYNLETQLRLLVALPLLVMAETFVHQKLQPVVKQFTERQLVSENALPEFQNTINSAMRLRNSVLAELVLLVFVYTAGALFIRPMPETISDWWLAWVSLPLFQFLLLRWYWRVFIWSRFLWQVSKLELNILPTHSDRCGGLSFLSMGCLSFAPVLLAQGTMLAAMMAQRIFYADATLTDFKMEFFGIVTVIVLAMLVPLMVFLPRLVIAKRVGEFEYGGLAQRYVLAFDRKWVRGNSGAGDGELIGSADIQSLADLTNAFSVIERMRIVPFDWRTVAQLAFLTLLPVLPLALTVMPVREVAERLLKIVL